MTEQPSRLIVLTRAPYSGNALREGLDVALTAAAFGEPVTLLFSGEGALALVKTQQNGAPGQKGVLPTIAMLEMYDIEELLVPEHSLNELGLMADQLVEAARVIDEEDVVALYRRSLAVLHF